MILRQPTFDANAERRWLDSLGSPKDTLRQEVVGRQLAEHLPRERRLAILDIGCGQGSQAIRLARKGHHVVGVDSSPNMLALCRRQLKFEEKNVRRRVTLIRGDGQQVAEAFEPGGFDAALCQGVLAYTPRPEKLLRAIGSAVRPGGIVSLLTVSAETARRTMHQGAEPLVDPAAAEEPQPAFAATPGRGMVVERHDAHMVAFDRPGMALLLGESSLEEVLAGNLLRASFLDEAHGKHDPHRAEAPFIHTICRPLEISVA